MSKSGSSISETLGRLGDRFARLVLNHLQLMRLEVETEARSVARRTTRQVKAVGIAAPFIVAGVAVLSLGVALSGGRLLDPLLGGWGTPLAFIVVGAGEGVLAMRWMGAALRRINLEESASAEAAKPAQATSVFVPADGKADHLHTVLPSRPVSGDGRAGHASLPDDHHTMHATVSSAAASAAPGEEKNYGAVGRT